jgi:ubiquinone/menaquinone biosynthesis C-methylase UbiE
MRGDYGSMNPAEFANIARAERDFWWYRGMRRILFRLLDPVAVRGAHVLEAGCGTGHLSKVLAERYQWRMTALDLASEGLDYARGYGLRELVRGDMTALPFPAAAFDGLISMDVIVHLPRGEEGRAVNEFARVVKPGGFLALRVSALNMLRSRHSIFGHERQRFTLRRLRQAVEAAGFSVHRATYLNSLLLPVALFKFRVWEPLTRAPASSGVETVPGWLDKLLYAPLHLEASMVGRGMSFAVGQSILLLARKNEATSGGGV